MFSLPPLLTTLIWSAYVSAQSSTSASMTGTSSRYPIASLFLPMGNPGNLGASIISINPNATLFAIGCMTSTGTGAATATDDNCNFSPSQTVTQGVSTLVYTMSFDAGGDGLGTVSNGATITCSLEGAATSPVFVSATQGVCTGVSQISGLGEVGSTTTLASTEINYVPVTITAGAAKIASASARATQTSSTGASSSSTAGAYPTATAARLAAGGAVGMAVLGFL